jgi:hypothetical protein
MKLPAIHSNAKNRRIGCPPLTLAAQKFFLRLNGLARFGTNTAPFTGGQLLRKFSLRAIARPVFPYPLAAPPASIHPPRSGKPQLRTALPTACPTHADSTANTVQILSLSSQWFGKIQKCSHAPLKCSKRCYSLSIGLGFAPKQKNEPRAKQRQGLSKNQIHN